MANLPDKIMYDPNVCSGKPCIKGTRIPVHIILDLLAAGENFEGIKRAYPNISESGTSDSITFVFCLLSTLVTLPLLEFISPSTSPR